jgi:hypothetical protein
MGGIFFLSFSNATDAASYSQPKSLNTAATFSIVRICESCKVGPNLESRVFITRAFLENGYGICVAIFEVVRNRVYRLALLLRATSRSRKDMVQLAVDTCSPSHDGLTTPSPSPPH